MPFSEQTVHFLVENKKQNNKEWFKAHAAEYQEFVVNPFIALVESLSPTILDIDEYLICEAKVGKSISRIYRDTRFARDKSFFRDVMWCVFIRNKKLYYGPPTFFFEIAPHGCRYGCGYYQADAPSMESIRSHIVNKDKTFTRALKAYTKQSIFEISGDMYKKSRFPSAPEQHQNWLDRKSIVFLHCCPVETAFSPGFASELAKDLRLLQPIYDFLIHCELNKN